MAHHNQTEQISLAFMRKYRMHLLEVIGTAAPISQYMFDKIIAYLWRNHLDDATIERYAQEGGIEYGGRNLSHTRAFRQWFRATFEDRAWDAYNAIIDRMTNGTLTVYREITAPANWQPDPNRHPGTYWSWDEQTAEAHWGSFANGEVKWIIVGQVVAKQIDWVATLANNAAFDYENEREIQLIPNGRVTVVNYYQRR